MLGTCKKNDKTPLSWSEVAEKEFAESKQILTEVASLAHPNLSTPIALMCDASDKAIGACVQQRTEQGWAPLGFFSRKLSSSELNYSTYDRELLSIFAAIKYFRYLLEGRNFIVFTDHKPLVKALTRKNDTLSPRQINQLTFIAEFTTDIRHVSGKENVVADTFSRISQVKYPEAIDFQDIAKAQEKDEQLKQIIKNDDSSLKLQKLFIDGNDNLSLYCDTSTGKVRPYIPSELRKAIFNTLHGLAHPGVKSTVKLITDRFVWPGVKKDVAVFTKTCIPCQRAKVSRHVFSPLAEFKVPNSRFTHINIDIVGPMPSSQGYTYCLTCIDRFTRWPEAIPIIDIKAETVAQALYSQWFARFGIPESITTDQGSQFRSELFRVLAKNFGIKLSHTTAYHPQANGIIERWHRTLKQAIMCHTSVQWTLALPAVLLGLRTVFKKDLNCSAAELVYGQNLRLPGQFFSEKETVAASDDFVKKLNQHFQQLGSRPTSQHCQPRTFIFQDLNICSHVFLRVDAVKPSLHTPYTGPYEVVKRGDKTFSILINGKTISVSIDRVKPAHIASEENKPSTDVPAPQPEFALPPTSHLPPSVDQPPTPSPVVKTRAGRRVRFPKKYTETIYFDCN